MVRFKYQHLHFSYMRFNFLRNYNEKRFQILKAKQELEKYTHGREFEFESLYLQAFGIRAFGLHKKVFRSELVKRVSEYNPEKPLEEFVKLQNSSLHSLMKAQNSGFVKKHISLTKALVDYVIILWVVIDTNIKLKTSFRLELNFYLKRFFNQLYKLSPPRFFFDTIANEIKSAGEKYRGNSIKSKYFWNLYLEFNSYADKLYPSSFSGKT